MPSRKLLRRGIVEDSDEDVVKLTLAEQLNNEANEDAEAHKSATNSAADPNSQEEQPKRRTRKIIRRV